MDLAIKIIILIVLLLIIVANVLVDFVLNLNAPYTMKAMIDGGGTPDALDLSIERPDAEFEKQADAWFVKSCESTTITAEDGMGLFGWKIINPASATNHLYGVFCHGYTATPSTVAKYAYHFYLQGYSVWMPAARGHERNMESGYIQMGWQDSKDLVGWINQIVETDPEAKIVLWGVSMGGAEVMMASGWDMPNNLKCIVEDCGYSSVWDEFSLQIGHIFHLPAFPLINLTSLFCKLRAGYSFKEATAKGQLAKTNIPMLFIHGDADTFVPFDCLQINYDACASPNKQKLVVKGAMHGMAAAWDPELYWSTVDSFVSAHV